MGFLSYTSFCSEPGRNLSTSNYSLHTNLGKKLLADNLPLMKKDVNIPARVRFIFLLFLINSIINNFLPDTVKKFVP